MVRDCSAPIMSVYITNYSNSNLCSQMSFLLSDPIGFSQSVEHIQGPLHINIFIFHNLFCNSKCCLDHPWYLHICLHMINVTLYCGYAWWLHGAIKLLISYTIDSGQPYCSINKWYSSNTFTTSWQNSIQNVLYHRMHNTFIFTSIILRQTQKSCLVFKSIKHVLINYFKSCLEHYSFQAQAICLLGGL